MTRGRRSGALVISLDFELRWGVRDHCPRGAPYERNLFGAREVVPRTLSLFEEFGVAGTWATVGFLFARSRRELEVHRPTTLPEYRDRSLFPYDEPIGDGEADDALHFAPSLLERISETPRQEVATHTYSHYFCGEAGQSRESFRADLESAVAIAATRGVTLRSIVFPRNQHNPEYDELLLEQGIVAYRGNPTSWMWRFSDREGSAGVGKRAMRLADSYLDVSGDGSVGWDEIAQPGGLADVRASFFVRPFSPSLRAFESLRLRRLRLALQNAARERRVLHLWWHPHNFGAYPEESLRFLRGVLEEFSRCRDAYGMESLSMAEVADRAMERSARVAQTAAGPLVAAQSHSGG